jgi:hypothetical protein
MMFMCTTKFDIEEKELAFIKHYMTKEEEEEAAEEKNAQLPAEDLTNLISDDEDDNEDSNEDSNKDGNKDDDDKDGDDKDGNEDEDKDEDKDGDEDEDEDEDEDDDNPLPLPPTQLTTHHGEAFHGIGNFRKRVSSRVRVPSKRLKGYIA